MDWQSEHELLNRLRKLQKSSPPREEFVERLRNVLDQETNQIGKSKRLLTFSLKTGVVTAMLASAFGLYMMAGQIQKEQPAPAKTPLSSYHIPLSNSQEQLPKPTVPSLEQTKPVKPMLPSVQKEERQTTEEAISKPTEKSVPSTRTVIVSSKVQPSDYPVFTQAMTYLQEVAGEDATHYQVNRMLSNLENDYVVMNRMVNNIPILTDSYSVTLDKSGKPQRSTVQTNDLTGLTFLHPSKAIPKNKAVQIFGQNAQLVYSEGEGRLQYVFPISGDIDAENGQVWKTYRYHPDWSLANMSPIPVTPGGKKLTVRTEDEAKTLLQEWGVSIDAPIRVHAGDGVREFVLENGNQNSVRLTVREDTGEVLDYENGQYTGKEDVVSRPDQEQVKEVARQLQAYITPDTSELLLGTVKRAGDVETYVFYKSYQGLPVIDHSYAVHFDVKKKKLVGLNSTLTREVAQALPDRSKAMSVDKAIARYLASRPLQLAYIYKQRPGSEKAEPRLVYHIYYHDEPLYFVDALTGELVR
ncbi:hypothetical protein ACQCN2_06225 [Brevibacillus ginsengisoli]|uniref:hypothetical protein n=1 Tax=Brevibacillus ginsengisoli TaxID=363854 RepID=UPI003CED335F